MKDAMAYYNVRDFQTIRICCSHAGCKAVIELAPALVEPAMKKTNASCPLCGKSFVNQDAANGSDVVSCIAKAVIALNSLATQVVVQFPVKVD